MKSNTLNVEAESAELVDRAIAEKALAGIANNAAVAVDFAKNRFGELSLNESVAVLEKLGRTVNKGDLHDLEAILTAQIMSLNTIYTELSRRAAANMGQYLDATEKYLRLALKAQTQCRATAETLAVLKNPPVVYAKQANFAQGHQQVNNAVQDSGNEIAGPKTRARTRTRENDFEPNKLLEHEYDEWLDFGAAEDAIDSDPALEAMAEIDRTENGRRKGSIRS